MRVELSELSAAIEAAERYLLAEARDGFPETRHVLSFPRRAGFTAGSERQSSDVFARAVLAGALLDAAELEDDSDFAKAVRELAGREADYVAGRKLRDRAGGWSYFPDLPELPPDADSLSAALLLFTRAAPRRVALCEGPIGLALEGVRDDGGLGTWLLSPEDPPDRTRTMRRGIERFWGDRVDADVCAHFYYALWTHDAARFGEAVRKGAAFVESRQDEDGAFPASWYHGRAYGTGLAIRLLVAMDAGASAVSRAVQFLVRHQRRDGSWEVFGVDPQETALALWALALAREPIAPGVVEAAVACLLDYQSREGHWGAWPWIKMEVARSGNGAGPTLTYASRTVTAAFCLRALLWARRALEAGGA